MKSYKTKKDIAKKYFDKWAHTYDRSILQHVIFKTSHRMLFKEIAVHNFINKIKGDNRQKLKILDVGCGTGELAHRIISHFRKTEVHGIDISKTMIEKAKAKRKSSNIKFKTGDVENLPYKDKSFDIITCSHSFHHYPDKNKALQEMHRVLRPNGRLMIIDGCRDVFFGRIIFNIVEKIEKHVYHLFDKEFRFLFKKTGFNNIVQKRFNFVPLLMTIGTAIK